MEISSYLKTVVQNKAIEVDRSDQIQIGQYKFFLLPEVLQETSLAALARFIFAVNPRCPFPHG